MKLTDAPVRWAMRRRSFLCVLGAAGTMATPLLARAQQPGKVWRVGQLLPGSAAVTGFQALALEKRLAELGDDRLVAMTDRYVPADPKGVEAEIAAISPSVDLMVVWGTIAGVAAKRLAPQIPVIFLSVGAPVDIGLVESLAHPGGNMTGVTFEAATQTYAKRLELLKDILPALDRVAVLRTRGDPNVPFAMQSLERSAPKLGVHLLPVDFDAAAFAQMEEGGAQAVIVIAGAVTFVNHARIAALALAHHLPSCSGFRQSVQAGGLISLGPDLAAIARQGAGYVDKIIHGGKPADLPVEQPERYDIYLNLKTAKALGLNIPPSLLARADEVIE
jgi:putative tryptophan/tyrosine transport system substrate-binding protein